MMRLRAILLLAAAMALWTLGDVAAQTGPETVLPCTSPREELNFPTYWLGPKFEGLELSTVSLECSPQGSAIIYMYGDCTPRGGGCSLPLQIHNYPAHIRNKGEPPSGPSFLEIPSRDETVDGVPATSYKGSFEVYHPETTVHIGGDAAPKGYVARLLTKAPDVPADVESLGLEFDDGCVNVPTFCNADRRILSYESVSMIGLALTTILPFFAGLAFGRRWLLLFPAIGWPVFYLGLYMGWWGFGVGEFWHFGLVVSTLGGTAAVWFGLALRWLFLRVRSQRLATS